MCQTPPVSMKGEITGSKRHLKGHKSKLSFSRFDDPRVTSRLFPHSIVLPRNARWANHQVINCSSARPPGRLAANLEENREISGLGTDFFGHQSTLPKKAPNDFLGFVTKSREEEALLGEKTSQREFSRKEGAAAAALSCAGNGKQAFVSSLSPSRCDLDKPAWNSPLKFPTVAWNKAKVRERHGTQCQKTEGRLSQGGKFS